MVVLLVVRLAVLLLAGACVCLFLRGFFVVGCLFVLILVMMCRLFVLGVVWLSRKFRPAVFDSFYIYVIHIIHSIIDYCTKESMCMCIFN